MKLRTPLKTLCILLAAACTLAAAEQLKDRFSPEHYVVLVLCGGNISVEDLARF